MDSIVLDAMIMYLWKQAGILFQRDSSDKIQLLFRFRVKGYDITTKCRARVGKDKGSYYQENDFELH